jgi:hypothetical protein
MTWSRSDHHDPREARMSWRLCRHDQAVTSHEFTRVIHPNGTGCWPGQPDDNGAYHCDHPQCPKFTTSPQ